MLPSTILHEPVCFSLQDSRIGTPVTQILAIDDDGGEEGRLSYSFSSHPDLQEFHRKFNIDPVTGEITTAVELDREEKPELQVIVVVSDHDSPPNSVTRSLLISLEDVDDNEPNFDTCPNVRASFRTTDVSLASFT